MIRPNCNASRVLSDKQIRAHFKYCQIKTHFQMTCKYHDLSSIFFFICQWLQTTMHNEFYAIMHIGPVKVQSILLTCVVSWQLSLLAYTKCGFRLMHRKPCSNSTWISWFEHGFLFIWQWLQIALHNKFYAIMHIRLVKVQSSLLACEYHESRHCLHTLSMEVD